MFKIAITSLSLVFTNADSLPHDKAATVTPWDYGIPLEEMYGIQLCQQGLEMARMTEGVSDYDGIPMEEEEIREINRSGEILVSKFCGPMV